MIKLFKVFKVGDHGEVPGAEVYWMRDFDKWYRLYFYSFLLESDDGYVLINTGLPDDLSLRNEFLRNWAKSDRCKFTVREEEKIENILRRLNLNTDDISHIIITPFQDYTIGRLHLFKRAFIYFSKTGWYHDVVNPSPSPFLNRDIYFPKHIRNYIFEEAWNRIRLVEDEEVIKGVEIKWSGCHHRSSMVVKFFYNGKRVCISDSAFLMGNFEQNIPIGIAEDIYECLRTYDYMRRECNIVIPAYDPENLNRFKEFTK
ncbi:MBL fold metallo-hydrolase [Saccharolobus islandicus]|uniref:Zn-dependent hydrolase, including glyoxylase n=1 Tax=Saccharolobus islandicus LAL14/1 TaxID=1241935 RepID=M9UCY7_SACIS|nr:Zn-dependent hydrolase including glyoxylase [Sulfolobus islandicus]AGJ62050.1 Zn-dependent hydrolase, including glyoxylase [Sulfolobus islandicus LAL14/1]